MSLSATTLQSEMLKIKENQGIESIPKYIPRHERGPEIVEKADMALGKKDFLKLICTQLQNQNPLDPMKDTEFIAQMASFTTLEHMADMRDSVEELSAHIFLGKNVSVVQKNGAPVYGLVEAVSNKDDKIYVNVNGQDFPVKDIRQVYITKTKNNIMNGVENLKNDG